jgi:signal transduction histidine kinase
VLADSGWIENDSLASGDSGSFLERRRARIAGLAGAPGTDEARLRKLIREAPEEGYFGMLDARTIAAGRPIAYRGEGYGIVVLADKRDLIASKHVDHEVMLASFILVLALPAFLLAFGYLRLIRPIGRLAEAARAAGAGGAGAGIDAPLPGESRRDEIGFVSSCIGAALRDARRSRARLEEFVGDVLHELKNPVSSLRGRIELARIRGSGDAEASGLPAADLDRLAADVGRIERLLADLASLSAADSQDVAGESRPSEILRDLVGAYVELGKPVALDSALDGGEAVPADPETIGSLVRILVDNALDFGPRDEPVIVSAESDGTFVRVAVSDRGPGVPIGMRDWVFERFASTRKDSPEPHAGLGLAIARSLASRIRAGDRQASIVVGDAPGGGALFTISLPRA